MIVPTITTPRLILRPFVEEDAAAMTRVLSQEGVLRYFPATEPPDEELVQRIIRGLVDHWHKRGYGLWAVESRASGELLGRCGLQYLPETDEVEIDYILGRPFWGQGLATEAGRASLGYGFEDMGFERIVGIVHTGNIASRRVLEKLGMARIERRAFFGMDCYRYAIERPAWAIAERTPA